MSSTTEKWLSSSCFRTPPTLNLNEARTFVEAVYVNKLLTEALSI